MQDEVHLFPDESVQVVINGVPVPKLAPEQEVRPGVGIDSHPAGAGAHAPLQAGTNVAPMFSQIMRMSAGIIPPFS